MTITWDPDAPFRAAGASITAAETRRLLASGLVRPVLRDVLVATDHEDSPQLRATAARLLLDGVLDGVLAVGFGSAAWVHAGTAAPDDIELAFPHGSYRPGIEGVRIRQVALLPHDAHEIAGVRVTTPTRTAADLARDLPPAEARTVLERLREATGLDPRAVRDRLDDMPSARNVVPARRLVRQWMADG